MQLSQIVQRICRIAFAEILLSLSALTGVAYCQAGFRLLKPPEIETARSPEVGTDVKVTLHVKYADNAIYNPATNQNDKVHLRSYGGELVAQPSGSDRATR